MTTLSIAAAARAAGVSRTTIYDRINEGELSRTSGGGIDPVELIRVFGALQGDGSDTRTETRSDTRSDSAAVSSNVQVNGAEQHDLHAIENERWLRELVDQQRTEINERNRELKDLRREKEEAVRDAEARAERREQTWQRQIDVLTGLLPAPAEEPVPVPEQKPGFFGRLFGGPSTG